MAALLPPPSAHLLWPRLCTHARAEASSDEDADARKLVVVEGSVLGEGAFSRVCKASEETTGRTFAMKRMAKSAAMQCPEHVFCEQLITRNMAHPFCSEWAVLCGGGGTMRALVPTVLLGWMCCPVQPRLIICMLPPHHLMRGPQPLQPYTPKPSPTPPTKT